MNDFSATSVAPAFWKLRAFPGHPVVLTRTAPDGPYEMARYVVSTEAEVVPKLEELGHGLFQVTSYYKVASGEIREATDYVLIFGPFSLLRLSKPLGAAFQGALS